MRALLATTQHAMKKIAADLAWAREPIAPITSDAELFATYNIQIEKTRIAAGGLLQGGTAAPALSRHARGISPGVAEHARRWRQLCEKYAQGDGNGIIGRGRGGCRAASFVAVGALHALVTLLRLEAQRRDGPRLEPAQADRLVGFLAIAVAAVLDALQRRVDLGDELALAVARPQLDAAIGLERGAVGEVGLATGFPLSDAAASPTIPPATPPASAAASAGNIRAAADS